MAQWSSMPSFHSSMEQPGGVGALHWIVAAFPPVIADYQSATTRLPEKAASYPEPHCIPLAFVTSVRGVPQMSHPPQAVASPSMAQTQCASDDTDHTPDTAAPRQGQAPTSVPIRRTSLLNPGVRRAEQQWQLALRLWQGQPSEVQL
jgi:hypothetical protein